MRNDDYYSSFKRERKKKTCGVNAVLFCHKMELIVAYYYCGPQQQSTAQHLFMLLYNYFSFSFEMNK